MRIVFIPMLLLASALSAHARTEPLEDSVSPNHRYRLQAVERGTPPQITYDLVRRRNGALLHRFESGYQPEEGELSNWSWNHSTGAQVDWSPDSRYVAIDETVHRYSGEVLMAEITRHGVRRIELPESAILTATKRHWDRHHIGFQEGWISADEISLLLAGKEAETFKSLYIKVVLRVRVRKAVVISCHELPE